MLPVRLNCRKSVFRFVLSCKCPSWSLVLANISGSCDITVTFLLDVLWCCQRSVMAKYNLKFNLKGPHSDKLHTTQRCALLTCSWAAQVHAQWIRKRGHKRRFPHPVCKGPHTGYIEMLHKVGVIHSWNCCLYVFSSPLDISLRRCVEGQGAVFLDVSSPSSPSVLTEERSTTESPSRAVASLFSDSSIQNIVDRYTRELNISLRGTVRTTGAHFFNLSR